MVAGYCVSRQPYRKDDGDMDITGLASRVTGATVRGVAELPSGSVALTLEGGSVLVCKSPRLLSEHAIERLLAETRRTLAPHATALAAIGGCDGPDTAARLEARRAEGLRRRDRATVSLTGIDDVPEAPAFTADAIGTGRTDQERQPRTEAAGRETPDIR